MHPVVQVECLGQGRVQVGRSLNSTTEFDSPTNLGRCPVMVFVYPTQGIQQLSGWRSLPKIAQRKNILAELADMIKRSAKYMAVSISCGVLFMGVLIARAHYLGPYHVLLLCGNSHT